jgi:hypothetical protein
MEATATDFQEPPLYTAAAYLKLEIECTLMLSEQMLQIAKERHIQVGMRNPGEVLVSGIIDSLWMIVTKFMKVLFKYEQDERQLQNLLNIIQIWVTLSGSVGSFKVRDQFLKMLQ